MCVANLCISYLDSGYFVSILFMDILGRKNIQLMGFVMLAILYTVLALQWGRLSPDELFFVYAATFFFSNFGPNATTFILPSETVRSLFFESIVERFALTSFAIVLVGLLVVCAGNSKQHERTLCGVWKAWRPSWLQLISDAR